MILLQNPNEPVPTNPIEIDAAIVDMQSKLSSNISWLTKAYGRAYRNIDLSTGETIYFPEIYLGEQSNSYRYLNVTPDNDKTGQCFFFVQQENIEYKQLEYKWNMQDMRRFEILDNELTFTKMGWIYHFNSIDDELRDKAMNITQNKLQ